MTITEKTDVLVAGGGTAGAVAAIQAARAGAQTTLIEMSGQLGGTMTTGGVDFPAIYETLVSRGFAGWVTMDFDPPREWEGTIDEQMTANKKYLEDVLGVDLEAA